MKRIISLVLAVVLALTIAPFAIASNRTISDGEKLLSASDEWTMGSGWMDLSTPDEISNRYPISLCHQLYPMLISF